jgi:hypothetical protein
MAIKINIDELSDNQLKHVEQLIILRINDNGVKHLGNK